jgi:hypothetical protein
VIETFFDENVAGARLCPQDQPQHVSCNSDAAGPDHGYCGALRLVLRTQPRSALPVGIAPIARL